MLFAGRIERDKGVFDLLTIARSLAERNRLDIEFDLCGSGGALDRLRKQAGEAGLASRFRCHGHCDSDRMRQFYARTHVVIVPTTSRFVEGFNKVVAEAVIAGRPVITSSVCPALEYVRDAVVEVPPDDPGAYRDAILRLSDDEELYRAKQAACAGLRDQFFDAAWGWEFALARALQSVGLLDGQELDTAIIAADPPTPR